jgi:hypothetical protein
MSDIVERILADRDQRNRANEAYDLKMGLPLGGRWYCHRCQHRHDHWSAIGLSHEQYGDPVAVRAAKREGFTLLPDAARGAA